MRSERNDIGNLNRTAARASRGRAGGSRVRGGRRVVGGRRCCLRLLLLDALGGPVDDRPRRSGQRACTNHAADHGGDGGDQRGHRPGRRRAEDVRDDHPPVPGFAGSRTWWRRQITDGLREQAVQRLLALCPDLIKSVEPAGCAGAGAVQPAGGPRAGRERRSVLDQDAVLVHGEGEQRAIAVLRTRVILVFRVAEYVREGLAHGAEREHPAVNRVPPGAAVPAWFRRLAVSHMTGLPR